MLYLLTAGYSSATITIRVQSSKRYSNSTCAQHSPFYVTHLLTITGNAGSDAAAIIEVIGKSRISLRTHCNNDLVGLHHMTCAVLLLMHACSGDFANSCLPHNNDIVVFKVVQRTGGDHNVVHLLGKN